MKRYWEQLDDTDRFFCVLFGIFSLVSSPFVAAAAYDFFAEINF